MRRRAQARRVVWLILFGVVILGGALPAQDDAAKPAAKYGVSGLVTDPEGTPLAGATVWVRLKDQNPTNKHSLGEDWLAPVSVKTDDAGGFSVPMEVDGPYVVFMIHPEHPPHAVDKPADDGFSIEFSFSEPIAYSGYVQDAEGESIPGADVTAAAPTSSLLSSPN